MDRNIITEADAADALARTDRVSRRARVVDSDLLRRMAIEALAHTMPLGAAPIVWESYSEPDRITWLRCAWSLATMLGHYAGPLPDVGHPGLLPVPPGRIGARPRGLRGALNRIVRAARGGG